MDKIAIIGSGYMARIIADRSRELGIESHCFSNDKEPVCRGSVNFEHLIDIFDIDGIIEICRKNGINGVIATTELTILPAAKVASALQLNCNSVKSSAEITDKTLVRQKVAQLDKIRQPMFWVSKQEETPEIPKFPVIVKPIAAGGKRGISVVKNANELPEALEQAKSISKVQGALVEEYLEGGQEYSVESLSFHGRHHIIQVTQKDSSGAPHCVELGHHQPAAISAQMRAKIDEAVSQVLTAVSITEGPCHTEIKIIDNEIYLIEVNGRPGGDHITYPLTELSTGFPYVTGIIMAALNKLDENQCEHLQQNYCGVYFVTKQTAFLKDIFDHCEDYPWFYKKNCVSGTLQEITHNDGFNTNFFMYYSKDGRPQIPPK